MSENDLTHIGGKHFAVVIALLLALGLGLAINFSIQPPERAPPKGTPYSNFQAHKTRWAEQRPSRYSVSIERLCFCKLWSVRVTVSAADVTNLKYLVEPSDPAIFADRRYHPRNVDEVFDVIEAAYSSKAYDIEVTFDDTYGFPVRAFIDRDHDTADDEQTIELSAFDPG